MKTRVSSLLALLLSGPAAAQGPDLKVFTTSKWGNAAMKSWADAGIGTSGLAAADSVCRSLAANAGLWAPDQFVAWLSDRDNDAYCRVLGLAGKRSANCGQDGELPDAGPWRLTNGTPFAHSLASLVAGVVLSPVLHDEFGNRIHFPYESFTATRAEGTLNTIFDALPDCERWTSNIGDPNGAFAPLGYTSGSTEAWTDAGGAVSCNGTRRLVCIQKGSAAPLSMPSVHSFREGFITASNIDGNFGGLAQADAICREAADAAGLREADTFKALLASNADGVGATDRFVNDGPWYRVDGLMFARSIQEIVDGEVTNTLHVTEHGDYVGYAVAYTGANDDGSPTSINCADWSATNAIANGLVANQAFFGPSGGHNWLSAAQSVCMGEAPNDWPRKLYCLSDSALLFRDGLE